MESACGFCLGSGIVPALYTMKKTTPTSREIGELLPSFLSRLSTSYQQQPRAIMDAWPLIIGPSLSPMTRAISFQHGVLTVAVSHASLYSLLAQHDKNRLLDKIRKTFPQVHIKTILFKRQ